MQITTTIDWTRATDPTTSTETNEITIGPYYAAVYTSTDRDHRIQWFVTDTRQGYDIAGGDAEDYATGRAAAEAAITAADPTITSTQLADEPADTYRPGQLVYAINTRQNPNMSATSRITTRKLMEIASERIQIDNEHSGYRLRKPGSAGKGGQIIWHTDDLEPITQD